MTIDQFDNRMKHIAFIQKRAKELLALADGMETDTWLEAGVWSHNREPGFPCWSIGGADGYFNTPRQALEAKEKAK